MLFYYIYEFFRTTLLFELLKNELLNKEVQQGMHEVYKSGGTKIVFKSQKIIILLIGTWINELKAILCNFIRLKCEDTLNR